MQITVNGKTMEVTESITASELIDLMQLKEQCFALEHNGEVVSHSRLAQTSLRRHDRIEVVRAIGGG